MHACVSAVIIIVVVIVDVMEWVGSVRVHLLWLRAHIEERWVVPVKVSHHKLSLSPAVGCAGVCLAT